MAVKKWVLAGSAVLLLVVLGAGYYQFQKTEPLSADAQALIATVQYPEYQANLSNRNFFMAAGIEAATDKEAEELGRLRYHRSWQLLAKGSVNEEELNQDTDIKKYLEPAVILSSSDKRFLKEYRVAINRSESLPFIKNKQTEMIGLVNKFSAQIDRYAKIYNQDYQDLPISALGLTLPNTINLMDMHTLLLAKITLSSETPAVKIQQSHQYLAGLRQVEVVSDLNLITQSQNLRRMEQTINIINELAAAESIAVREITPLTPQEMSVKNVLVGEMLYRYRDTGNVSQTEFRKKIPKEVSLNQLTAAILPVIELSELSYSNMLPILAQGVNSKPYSPPIKYLRYKSILDIKSESNDFIKYAIAPRIVDYRIHLFNAIQSGLSVPELNAQDTYGQYTEEGQKLCLELPKEFKAQYESNAALCLMRPVK